MILKPEWPAPVSIKSAITSCAGGISEAPYQSMNLAAHVGDKPEHVAANRERLQTRLALSAAPQWLEQIHGTKIIEASADGLVRTADGSFTHKKGVVCAVMTADCLPILICNKAGTQVAAVHAGWRGLAAGILQPALATFADKSEDLLVYLGPAISQTHFEVGIDVLEGFFELAETESEAQLLAAAFVAGKRPMRFHADLYALARVFLSRAGVTGVYGGEACTFGDMEGDDYRFYSYRRQKQTGRMASLIWID
jgi:YfiH family protein